jgi:putative acetyltransferase
MVKNQYIPHAELLVTVNDNDMPTAFIGVTDNTIDALFVHDDNRGQGIGGNIIKQMQRQFEKLMLDVNEGNPSARAFMKSTVLK